MTDKEALALLRYELMCCDNFRAYQNIKDKIEKILGNYSEKKKSSRNSRDFS